MIQQAFSSQMVTVHSEETLLKEVICALSVGSKMAAKKNKGENSKYLLQSLLRWSKIVFQAQMMFVRSMEKKFQK